MDKGRGALAGPVTSSLAPRNLPRFREHGLEHRWREPAGVGVLAAGVKGGEHVRPAGDRVRARRGRRSGAGATSNPRSRSTRQQMSKAMRPRQTTTRRFRKCVPLGIEEGPAALELLRCGLVVGRGAAHRGRDVRAASARGHHRGRARSAAMAKPVACIARIRKSPDPPTPSPVNTRPVRLAPWAAGARPTSSTRASGSPKPGTGRPQ